MSQLKRGESSTVAESPGHADRKPSYAEVTVRPPQANPKMTSAEAPPSHVGGMGDLPSVGLQGTTPSGGVVDDRHVQGGPQVEDAKDEHFWRTFVRKTGEACQALHNSMMPDRKERDEIERDPSAFLAWVSRSLLRHGACNLK